MKNPIFATHVFAAASSATLGTALTYPLDSIKTLIQVGSTPSKHLPASEVLKRVQSFSGYSGLYSGFGFLALGRIFGLGARFGTYEILTAFCKDGREDNYVYVSEALLAGIASGAMESIVSSPFELLKLRAQVSSAVRNPSGRLAMDLKALDQTVSLLSVLSPNRKELIKGLKNYPWTMTGSGKPPAASDVSKPMDIIKLEGLSTLWRNLRSGLARDCVFGGVFFSSWQFLHLVMLDWKAVGMNPPPETDDEIGPLSPISVSLAAGLSGLFAAAASHGFDTTRSRSQCTVIPRYVSFERRLLKWKRPGNMFERFTGIHPSDRSLLTRGIWWRMARSGVASFAIVGSYFFALNHLVLK